MLSIGDKKWHKIRKSSFENIYRVLNFSCFTTFSVSFLFSSQFLFCQKVKLDFSVFFTSWLMSCKFKLNFLHLIVFFTIGFTIIIIQWYTQVYTQNRLWELWKGKRLLRELKICDTYAGGGNREIIYFAN